MRCPSCAFENPAAMKFCGECGARQAPRPADADRRQLTVLFCDLVGSAALADRLDPEELRELVRAYQRAAGAAIGAFEGHVAQHLGDGLLIYFGYPIAHEDDARRAVHAALGILDAMATLNETLPADQVLALRMGIHTGTVVAGEIGAGETRERLALGPTPNIAARLQEVAQPGSIVVSGQTRDLLKQYFALEALGPRALKGFTTPIDAYLMLAVQGAEPPETAMPRARAAAERALAIRPLAEAHAVLACVHAFYDWQWLEAESGFLRALALAPSYASAHQWYAMNCLLPLGRTAEAMSNLEAALRYEPLSLAIQTSIGIAHYFAGRWADALAAFAHALQLDAGFALAHSFVGQTLVELEQHSAAIRSLEHAVALAGRSPETLGALGYALGRSGEVARAHDIDGELERLSGSRHVAASHRAHLRAGLGDADAAIRLLGDAVAARAPDVIWTHLRPAYKPLAAHRGYEATLRPLALPGPAAGPGEPAVQPGPAELG